MKTDPSETAVPRRSRRFSCRAGGALLLPAVMGEAGVLWAEALAWIGADMILAPGCFYVIGRTRRRLAEEGEEKRV